MKKIICIGNQFVYPDSFGIEIYQLLKEKNLKDIKVIEGGLGGLNLALHFETDMPILIVDHGYGFEKNILTLEEIKKSKNITRYDHDTAFYYLINTLDIDKNIFFYISNDKKWQKDSLQTHLEKILELMERI